jgi:F420-dependent methylenetetrahydromethanopterin dehydrogenase
MVQQLEIREFDMIAEATCFACNARGIEKSIDAVQ